MLLKNVGFFLLACVVVDFFFSVFSRISFCVGRNACLALLRWWERFVQCTCRAQLSLSNPPFVGGGMLWDEQSL